MAESNIAIRTGGLGDLVLFQPTLKALRDRHGCAPSLITSSQLIGQVYKHAPVVEAVYLLRMRRVPNLFNKSLRKINRLADHPIGAIYDLDEGRRVFALCSRLERVAGEVVSAAALPERGPEEHEADYGLRMISETPDQPRRTDPGFCAAAKPVFPVTEREMGEAEAWLDQLGVRTGRRILLQAGNKKTMKKGAAGREENQKYWSEAKWAEVIDEATAAEDCSVLLCGSPEEEPWLEEIRKKCGRKERVRNVAAEMPIRRFMALSRMSGSLYTGVDTGPAHVAAAMGCPCCILFGPARSVNFLPLSWGQRVIPLEKFPEGGDRPRIDLIGVRDVVGAQEELLRSAHHPDDEAYRAATVIAT